MSKSLPARPNLDHLRRQSKTLLARLRERDGDAARTFAEHLPEAKGRTNAAIFAANYRLADAQSVIARQSGFASWPALARHVQTLRAFEGEWRFTSLEVDGAEVPASMLGASRLLMDGDRFTMESPEGTYEGVFNVDVEQEPPHLDIEFVAGPEAGQWSYAIFAIDGDDLTLCLGLTGRPRPTAFATKPGTGHALERLRRASASRPEGVTGGTRGSSPPVEAQDASAFDTPPTPSIERQQGEWVALEMVRDGQAMPQAMLGSATRTCAGREVRVKLGGQQVLHVRLLAHEGTTPLHVDHLHVGGTPGHVSLGLLEWTDEGVRTVFAPPGAPRPADFTCERGSGRTRSHWRKK